MKLHLLNFFKACNPSRTIDLSNPDERPYYIDFAAVRGGKIIEAIERTIALLSPDEPTCQLFTGHIGCGKSTELLRLKAALEQQNFHVIYFESSRDLDMADVSISDILLAIARSVSTSLEAEGIRLKASYFTNLFEEVKQFLQTPMELDAEAELSLGIARITARTKDNPKLREQLRQSLEPRTESILRAINEEILAKANQELQYRGKRGIVAIVDNLDRVSPQMITETRSLPEYLFVDRGPQLRRLNCHVVYTLPMALIFSNEYQALKNRLGGGVAPKVLPMVPVRDRTGRENTQGMALLRQLILARAFPQVEASQRLKFIDELFDSPETLDRLCHISGGHIRNLLGLLFNCLQNQDPPFSRQCVENAIKAYRDDIVLAIEDHEWQLISQVVRQQAVKGEQEYQTLLRSMFVFEYRDEKGRWFGINPALAETDRFRAFQQSSLN